MFVIRHSYHEKIAREILKKDYEGILRNGEEAKTKETWKYIAAALSMVGIYATVTFAFHYGSS